MELYGVFIDDELISVHFSMVSARVQRSGYRQTKEHPIKIHAISPNQLVIKVVEKFLIPV